MPSKSLEQLTSFTGLSDDADMSDALEVYQRFNKASLDKAVVNAKKYVNEVRNLCISCDVKSPLIDSIVNMEQFNIELLCKQVYYAMHAIDSIFEKIDAQGGGLTEFAMLIKLQNDSQHILNNFVSYVRTLPQVMSAYSSTMTSNLVDSHEVAKSTTDATVNAGTETLVVRSIVDVIKTLEKHDNTIKEQLQSDEDNLDCKFEPSQEVKEMFANDEYYKDELTYAEQAKLKGIEIDYAKEKELQAKPTKTL